MKAVLQRVKRASVSVDGEIKGQCGDGLLILLGVARGDCEIDAELLAKKILALRIFCDSEGKMNKSILDVDGELLVISQFTLMANYRHGNRPDFMDSAPPIEADRLYRYFISLVSDKAKHTDCGVFGAHMEVSLVNDGPVTICMDSEVLKKTKSGN